MKPQQHQMAVAMHLAARCKSQKGMLVYHGMGSGKTLTALIFAMTFPDHRVIIVTPHEIQFSWKAEVKRLELRRHIQWYTYRNLDRAKGKLSGAIVILDEAHNFIDELDDLRLQLIDEMRSSFKVLLLTGTPISSARSGWQELVLLMNIAAGKDVLPHNKTIFNKRYMIIDKKKAFIWGYLDPIIRHYHWIWRIYWQAIKGIVSQTLFSFVRLPRPLSAILQMTGLMRRSAESVHEHDLVERTVWQEVQDETSRRLNPLNILKAKWSFEVQKKIDRMVFGNFLAYYYRLQRLGFRDIHSLDVHKLGADIAPYISFYSIEKDDAYPTVKNHVKSVPYDSMQHALYVKLQSGLVEVTDIKRLRKTENEAEAGYYSNISETARDRYYDACRRISGLCIPNEKYFAPKFKSVIEFLGTSRAKRVVIYSEYASTYKYFQIYLDSIEHFYQILDISMSARQRNRILHLFEIGKIDVLLLHPLLTEGISIKGASQMHILEPQSKLHQFHQVAARVVRFMSHSHLPSDQRHVDIYLWQAVLSNDAIESVRASIVQTKESLKQWWHSNKEVVPPIPILLPGEPFRKLSNRYHKPVSDQTEEELELQHMFYMDVMLERFTRHLKDMKLPTGPVDCCVWNPDRTVLEACLANNPACATLYKS